MKRYGMILILVCLIFVIGCVSGGFKVPTQEQSTEKEESELIKEIQEIEKQLKDMEGEEKIVENATETEEEPVIGEETETEETEEILTNETTKTNKTIEEEEEVIEEEVVEEEAVDTSKLEKLEVQETQLVNLQIESKDADKDTVTYTFSKPLDATGKWQTKYGDAGEYVVVITASDGKTTSEKKILLVVKKKNVAPTMEGLQAEMKAKEGDVISLKPKVTDANKDEIALVFPAPFDKLGVWKTNHTSAGTYDLIVKASDGELETKFPIKLVVENVNVPPAISGLDAVMKIKEGEKVTLKPTVVDLDGDKVEITISEPVGNDGVWETSYTDHGSYKITVKATDGKDTTTFNIDLTVDDVNVAPEIIGVRLG